MKRVFRILLLLIVLSGAYFDNCAVAGAAYFAEASLDKNLMYIVVTASLLGVVKLKRNDRDA